MSDKHYISAQSLLEDSFRLGQQIVESDFKPSFILALWRGGAPIGIAVQEYLSYKNINTNHIAIRASSYSGIDGQAAEVALYGMNYLIKNVTPEDRFLIVDDVFDTGQTIEALINRMRERMRKNTPDDIRVAVPYYKPTRNKTGRKPDYYLHETTQWLKFPHSLEGLTDDEIKQHRPELFEILSTAIDKTTK